MSHLNLAVVTINEDNIEEKLYELFNSVDEDFTSEEYLWEVAKEKGFKSNLEYELKNAKEEYGSDIEKIIKYTIESAQGTWGNYYSDWHEVITKVADGFVVSIAISVS